MRPRKPSILVLTTVLTMLAFGPFVGAEPPTEPKNKPPGSNSDFLDGLDSTAFSLAGHEHDGQFLLVDGKAADAEALDGIDGSQFLRSDVDDVMTGRLSIGAPPLPFNGVDGYNLRVRGNTMVRGESMVFEPAEVSNAQAVRILHDGTKGMVFTSNVDSVYNPSPLFLGVQDSPIHHGMQIETDGRIVMGTGTTQGMPDPLAGLHVIHPGSSAALRVDDQLGDTTPFVVGPNGNVAIGTQATPDWAALYIKQHGNQCACISLDGDPGQNPQIQFRENQNQQAFVVKIDSRDPTNPNVLVIGTDGRSVPGNPAGISFQVYRTWSDLREAMRITETGNVGIGTSSPAAPLDVAGTARADALRLDSGVLGACGDSSRGTMQFVAGGSGLADTLYVCMKSPLDTFAWKAVAAG